MGLFSDIFGGGGSKSRVANLDPISLPGAGQLFGEARGFAEDLTPLALGAREQALGTLQSPESTTQFFEGFQPTSFEQALASQNFANILPDVIRGIKHNLSLSGIASSPALAKLVAKAEGDVGVQVGEFLTNLGNQRATDSLNSRLGIDPNQILSPFVNTGVAQAQQEAAINAQIQAFNAQANYLNDLANEQDRQSKRGLTGSLIGGTAGFFLGGPAGASLGASLGGGLSGGQNPIGFQDALALSGGIGDVFSGGFQGLLGGGGGGRNVFQSAPAGMGVGLGGG